MKGDMSLDYAEFQLSPSRTRYELIVAAGGVTEKLASGFLKPFLTHFRIAEEQFNRDLQILRLDPPPPPTPKRYNITRIWFTKGTLERFVKFVNTPEVLEQVTTIEDEVLKLKLAQISQESSSPKTEAWFRRTKELILSGDKKITGLSQMTLLEFKRPIDEKDRASKRELLKSMEARINALQQEQNVAFSYALAAGFDGDNMADLMAFAKYFGADRLSEACTQFMSLKKRKQEMIKNLEEANRIEAESSDSDMSLESDGEMDEVNEYNSSYENPSRDQVSEASPKHTSQVEEAVERNSGARNGSSRGQRVSGNQKSPGSVGKGISGAGSKMKSKRQVGHPDNEAKNRDFPMQGLPPKRSSLGNQSGRDEMVERVSLRNNKVEETAGIDCIPVPAFIKSLSVVDAISVFESKRHDTSENPCKKPGIKRSLKIPVEVSQASLLAEKSALNQWSGGSTSPTMNASKKTGSDIPPTFVNWKTSVSGESMTQEAQYQSLLIQKEVERMHSYETSPRLLQSSLRLSVDAVIPESVLGKNWEEKGRSKGGGRQTQLENKPKRNRSRESTKKESLTTVTPLANPDNDKTGSSTRVSKSDSGDITELRPNLNQRSSMEEKVMLKPVTSEINMATNFTGTEVSIQKQQHLKLQGDSMNYSNLNENQTLFSNSQMKHNETKFLVHGSESFLKEFSPRAKKTDPVSWSGNKEILSSGRGGAINAKEVSKTYNRSIDTDNFYRNSEKSNMISTLAMSLQMPFDNAMQELVTMVTSQNKFLKFAGQGRCYGHYKSLRDAKMRGEQPMRRAEREAKLQILKETLEKRKAEMDAICGRLCRNNTGSVRMKLQSDKENDEDMSDEAEEMKQDMANSYSSPTSPTFRPTPHHHRTKSRARGKNAPSTRISTSNQISTQSPSLKYITKDQGGSVSGTSSIPQTMSEIPQSKSVASFSDLRKENTKSPSGQSLESRQAKSRSVRGHSRHKSTVASPLETNSNTESQKFTNKDGRSASQRKSSASIADLPMVKTLGDQATEPSLPHKGRRSSAAPLQEVKPFLRKGGKRVPETGPGSKKKKASAASASDVAKSSDEDATAGMTDADADMGDACEIFEEFMNLPKISGSDEIEQNLPSSDTSSVAGDRSESSFEISSHNPNIGQDSFDAITANSSQYPYNEGSHRREESANTSSRIVSVSGQKDTHSGSGYLNLPSPIALGLPPESPPLWSLSKNRNVLEVDISCSGNIWQTSQKPLPLPPHPVKEPAKGLKRILKFGRKSKKSEPVVNDRVSASATPRGDDGVEEANDQSLHGLSRKGKLPDSSFEFGGLTGPRELIGFLDQGTGGTLFKVNFRGCLHITGYLSPTPSASKPLSEPHIN